MAKKKIKITLKTGENSLIYDAVALIDNNRIQYVENNCKMMIDFTQDCVKMVRKNAEYEISFHFQKENSYGTIIFLKEGNMSLPVALKRLEVTDTKLFIAYLLFEEEYEYCISY